MKIEFKEKFLNFYYFSHYPIIIGNLLIFIAIMVCVISIYTLGNGKSYYTQDENFKYTFFALLTVLIGFLYLLLTIIATIAIKKIKEHKNINLLEKFSVITLPIITIPLYSFLIYKGIDFDDIILVLQLAFGFTSGIIKETLYHVIAIFLPFINL